MAANDEFPRGWTIKGSFPAGTVPFLTALSVPGISHVITAINFTIYAGSAPATAVEAVIEDQFANPFGVYASNNVAYATENINWTGKEAYPVGLAIDIQGSAPVPAGWGAILEIQGYDI